MPFTTSGQVENTGSGTIAALNGAVTLTIPTSASVALQVSGSWSATLIFEASVDGTTWFTVPVSTLSAGTVTTTTIVNGAFLAGVGGYQGFRVRASAYSSGTATVSWNADSTSNIPASIQQGGAPWTTTTSITAITGAVTGSYSSKLKVEPQTNAITLAANVYTNVYTYSGTGFLLGFGLEVNNSAVIPRLIVDGDTVMDSNSFATLAGINTTANTNTRYQAGTGVIATTSILDFSFKLPIKFSTSIAIACAANSGLLTRTFNQGIVYIIKET